ncbi:response regulator [Pedobacter alpinus]|uniref:Two-component system response regulator n=1 Tax=Pedobacter alpinus TaxID=1590643 RepID=A0ABW5TNA7_9SPHI
MNKIETVYIIDDDDVYAYAVQRLISIQKLCNNVEVFKNGKEAIDFFTNSSLEIDTSSNIILLDVRMPVMNGWEFLESFMKLDYATKDNFDLYMISSSIDPKDTKKAAEIPLIKMYIFKPITFDDLKLVFNKE